MTRILIIKTGALGDVLRTTSILPGLDQRFSNLEVTWLTAPGARALVERHALVARTWTVDPASPASVAQIRERLAGEKFEWVLSLDDEQPLCELASAAQRVRLSGAWIDESGNRAYTDDVSEWFEMGLLSRLGKTKADALKVKNERSHPQIYADMFGIQMGQPELPLEPAEIEAAEAFYAQHGLTGKRLRIGLNTGAGGRWSSKTMPVGEVVRLIERLDLALGHQAGFVLLGGSAEADRNQEILLRCQSCRDPLEVVDGGDNSLTAFAALIDRLDLLVTSDSLALHMGVARRRPIVSFFAPTSAAEIELYGLGEKVISTAADYCSYKKDADNSSITAERVADACLRVLQAAARV
ncbi:MAG: glycosyltransferase family 9 protein [Planctomycetota bacterium]